MLEPCDAKVSRTVLRGLGTSNGARLLDQVRQFPEGGAPGSHLSYELGSWVDFFFVHRAGFQVEEEIKARRIAFRCASLLYGLL